MESRWVVAGLVVTCSVEALASSSRTRKWNRLANAIFLCVASLCYVAAPSPWTALHLECVWLFALPSWLEVMEEWIPSSPPLELVWPTLSMLILAGIVPHGMASLQLAVRVGFLTLELSVASVGVSLATIVALWVWSRRRNGNHGPIQTLLGPVLTPWTIPIFAIGNAAVEEMEFRCLLMTALMGEEDESTAVLVVIAVAQAVLFALQHVKGGVVGGLLVFLWGAVLGAIRILAKGTLLVYGIHIVADATIGVLIWQSERRNNADVSTAANTCRTKRQEQEASTPPTLRRRRKR